MESTQSKVTALRVSSKTSPRQLAGSIALAINENNKVELTYIGAGAGNNAVKALAIARGLTAAQGMDLWAFPMFHNTTVESDPNTEKVGMRMIIENKGYSN